MRLAIALTALTLTACGPTAPAPEAPALEAPAEVAAAAPAGLPMTTGTMSGMSDSADGDVALITINADGFAYANADMVETITAPTDYLGAADPTAPIAAGGQSFAERAATPNATNVELRRFIGAAPAALCSGSATHAAIVYMVPLTGLHIIAFTGAEAPGPTARDSAVCATYAYAVD
jgi:hypothetical protein